MNTARSGPVDLTTLSKRPPTGQAKFVSDTFHAASEKYGVPVDILFAIGWVESHWSMRGGNESRDHAFGVMGLRHSKRCTSLDRAVTISGFESKEIKSDFRSNVFAGASLLADIARQKGITETDLESWAPVVVAYEELADSQLQDIQVQQVYGALANGMGRSFPDRSILAIAPLKVSVEGAKSLLKK